MKVVSHTEQYAKTNERNMWTLKIAKYVRLNLKFPAPRIFQNSMTLSQLP